MSKVTVLVAVYNGEETICDALDSIKEQTFPDYEVIIINDASTDGTRDVIRPYLSDKRFSYIENSENIGQTASYVKALKRANGEYIAHLDDDNEWFPGSIEVLARLLDENPDKQVAYGGRRFREFWVEGGEITEVGNRIDKPLELSPEMVWGYYTKDTDIKPFIDANNLFIRKDALMEVGSWDPNLTRTLDWELTMRLIDRFPDGLITTDETLTFYNNYLGDLPGNRETFYDLGYTYLKHRDNWRINGQRWWPPDVKRKRLADRYKQLADEIRGYSLDDRTGKEINGLILKDPGSQSAWVKLIYQKIPGVAEHLNPSEVEMCMNNGVKGSKVRTDCLFCIESL